MKESRMAGISTFLEMLKSGVDVEVFFAWMVSDCLPDDFDEWTVGFFAI